MTLFGRSFRNMKIEDPEPFDRFLGRNHLISEADEHGRAVTYDMCNYAKQTVELYQKVAKLDKLKAASTPFVPEGSLTEEGECERGELSSSCCSVIMKALWLARLARPDCLRPIIHLATKVSCWTRNDDRKLYRLMCYISSTLDLQLTGYVRDDTT